MTRNIRELTEEQILEISKLALYNILSFDFLTSLAQQDPSDLKYRIEKELWDQKENLMVVRFYVIGLGNTWCSIWETGDDNYIDIDIREDNETEDVANYTKIYRLLQNWHFI